jgi:starch synthase (maltosyl-transferring)
VNAGDGKRYLGLRAACFKREHHHHFNAFALYNCLLSEPNGNARGMAPKIYHLHPLVAGPLSEWPRHFARCRAMGFDIVCVAPPFAPGASGDIFVTGDHSVLHRALQWNGTADEGIAHVSAEARRYGLALWLDLVFDRVSIDAPIRQRDEHWFGAGGCGGLPNPRRAPYRLDVAYARLDRTDVAEQLTGWWLDRLDRLMRAGVAGFRCLEPHRVPAAIWQQLIKTLRGNARDCHFLAWTPGLERAALAGLSSAGFDHVCSSLGWWDGRASWLVEEVEALRRIAPVIASPEPSFFERRAARLPPGSDVPTAYRLALRLAATAASGIFVPMGFEYATRRAFDAVLAGPEDFRRARDGAACDLSADIATANALVDRIASYGVDGEIRQLTSPRDPITMLLRANASDMRAATGAVVVVANPDTIRSTPFDLLLSPLPPQGGAALAMVEPIDAADTPAAPMAPGEVHAFAYAPTAPIVHQGSHDRDLDPLRVAAARIAIEAIEPTVPDGAFAVKRLVGETITVSADIFADGHDVLSAELLWGGVDEAGWHRVAMRPRTNDRWEASFTPGRIGRHRFTIEAWWDLWATFRHDISAKYAAGQVVNLEIEEGRRLIETAAGRSSEPERSVLTDIASRFPLLDAAEQVVLLLAPETAEAMHVADDRPFAAHHMPAIQMDVDRPQAGFASWYEMFPRSATDDPARHGTFADVIRRLPFIRAMGFDVLYLPPIHPIGTTNRKGRNNALGAEPGDVGSPYAIGGREGGHDAIHPALGTLDDFRALVAAARDNGLEIALDFAIQCSPDHPWLREHHDWFRWRPDGSMRYAENPPKKYEDIVNPDFHAEGSMPALWFALRDVVQFWVDQGVRIFRVDNPHTKPLPFWQWMIADIRGRYPDVIFLAEAFTRPKVMYRLAKIGFTQSYTYFTWRNAKHEIIEYMTELAAPPVSDFFRPNFFVNTPDINPPFLQNSGRPGFLIRAALACTLSGSWGMYSGFEICEAAPLPGREEYLDSEKYQIRVRDFTAPGNIVREITALNHIRRAQPALQTHLGVTFYPVFNDQILLYGKRRSGGHEMILIAVSLDPHHVQEAAIEIPLWEWGLPDHAALVASDLVRGHDFVWTGKSQHIRLDPAELPYSIWQIAPIGGA